MSSVQQSPNPNSGTHQKPLFYFSSWTRQTWGLVAGAFAAALIVLWIVLSARGQSGDPAKADDKSRQEKSAAEWIEQLKDKDFNARLAAAKALLALGKDARSSSAQLEAAIKDSAWEFATTLIPELGTNAESTFTAVGSTIKPPSPEEQRKFEEQRRERERKEREQKAKFDRWKDYMVTLLKALDKADPERMKQIKGKVVLDVLTEEPKSTSTFRTVGDRVETSEGKQR
jgi:hypothetical protein